MGGQADAARKIGVPPQRVFFILNKAKSFPVDLCIPVEHATQGKITRAMLRPDLFEPHPPPACHAENTTVFPPYRPALTERI